MQEIMLALLFLVKALMGNVSLKRDEASYTYRENIPLCKPQRALLVGED